MPALQKENKHRKIFRVYFDPKKGKVVSPEWKIGGEAEKRFFVYCLHCERRVFYFGISGTSPRDRLWNHVNTSKWKGRRLVELKAKDAFIISRIDEGKIIEMTVMKASMRMCECLKMETRLIKLFGSSFKLMNISKSKHAPKSKTANSITPEKRLLVRNQSKTSSVRRNLRTKNNGIFIPDFTITIRNKAGERVQITATKFGNQFITGEGMKSARNISRGIETLLRHCTP